MPETTIERKPVAFADKPFTARAAAAVAAAIAPYDPAAEVPSTLAALSTRAAEMGDSELGHFLGDVAREVDRMHETLRRERDRALWEAMVPVPPALIEEVVG